MIVRFAAALCGALIFVGCCVRRHGAVRNCFGLCLCRRTHRKRRACQAERFDGGASHAAVRHARARDGQQHRP